ncbi:MAG: hypothetical protein WA148_00090 [Actinomycetota bacterium]
MQFKQFRKKMEKNIFSKEEAQVVAFETPPTTLKLQLHQWVKAGDLIRLKRGLYAFSDSRLDKGEVARRLYSPCYISLEYALNLYGLIPDVPFSITLVTPKITRKFNTPYGQFVYHKIKSQAFFGYDPKTLIAEKEKTLLDYLYLNRQRLVPQTDFWRESRLQNLTEVNFNRAFEYAKKFGSEKLMALLRSVRDYASLDQLG